MATNPTNEKEVTVNDLRLALLNTQPRVIVEEGSASTRLSKEKNEFTIQKMRIFVNPSDPYPEPFDAFVPKGSMPYAAGNYRMLVIQSLEVRQGRLGIGFPQLIADNH